MFKKFKFKGEGRTLNDPPPKKEPAKPPQTAKPQEAPPPSPPQPEGPPPGPDNRQTKISARDAHAATSLSTTTNDDELKLDKGDLKGLRVGANVAPKTFADVAKASATKPLPLKANIRFSIPIKKEIVTAEAQFATSEPLEALYLYLEREVLKSADSIEIRNSFPQTVIPRDPNRTLASLKLHGQVMLHVTVVNPKLK